MVRDLTLEEFEKQDFAYKFGYFTADMLRTLQEDFDISLTQASDVIERMWQQHLERKRNNIKS